MTPANCDSVVYRAADYVYSNSVDIFTLYRGNEPRDTVHISLKARTNPSSGNQEQQPLTYVNILLNTQ
jgi:hypothetical protein